MPRAGATPASALFERSIHVYFPGLKRRSKPEQNSRTYRRAKSEQQHAPIEVDFICASDETCWYRGHQYLRSPKGEQHAGPASDERQQNAFGH